MSEERKSNVKLRDAGGAVPYFFERRAGFLNRCEICDAEIKRGELYIELDVADQTDRGIANCRTCVAEMHALLTEKSISQDISTETEQEEK